MWRGHTQRVSDEHEFLAGLTAWLVNSSGFRPHNSIPVTAETILGRPLRVNWEQAQKAKKDAARLKAQGRTVE